ncbi:MAG: hypothetical protein JGK17_21990 [Microcoleus sp. PH2017_10_PVI_O_A]|uniref:hypothetical protein n=1 Tax=unclassified Microcoleus TaxID=2642155 RepID=UPI001E04D2EB|nr:MULTISPECIES: hypothetical protein [unclassified Microcoleus]MCC3408208.1 hypothetical protein [Microcoleus sp. PH2017_10_PVI_O_A]MCC3462898.1 hypothetical protein [Microcoleus sp. PH2017_11_PCY_U_A]MCC3480753.1 hypothetical protein [Microcoleus sp. PH2017_12_PCY_D_A]MCC3530679.1 hypothetical protein [Microcoleus sp. PH2017_21_RUC_O_A]MCC3543030.1 hypothetical protein [Microcoleus sp. PH2017_22_RUC_O_B]
MMSKKETWIVYKVESMSAEGWRERKLMPSGGLTEMLTEEWDFSGKLPQIGDRVREYTNLQDPDNGITHGKDGDWIVTRINHFSSKETNQEIAVCYCAYQPIEANWVELKRGRPVNEILQAAEVG